MDWNSNSPLLSTHGHPRSHIKINILLFSHPSKCGGIGNPWSIFYVLTCGFILILPSATTLPVHAPPPPVPCQLLEGNTWVATVSGVLGDNAASRINAALVGALRVQILLFLSLPWCPEHDVFPCKNVSLLQLDESGLLDPKRTLDPET